MTWKPGTAEPESRGPGTGLTEQIVTLQDGRRLRTVVAGSAPGPLVVFESGMSAPAAEWVHTQREVSARVRTLSYDRAGHVGSDPDPEERTLERLTDDLAGVLDAMGADEPVVLVGHSWGGPMLRLFADRHPSRVAGLVFVDATLSAVMSEKAARANVLLFRLLPHLIRLGGGRALLRSQLPHGFASEWTESDQEVLRRDYLCVEAMQVGAHEAKQVRAALPLMRRLEESGTPDVPTICVMAGRQERSTAKLRPVFLKAAGELMAAAPQGRLVVAEQAGHLVPQEQPAIVRDAVLEVVERATGAKPAEW